MISNNLCIDGVVPNFFGIINKLLFYNFVGCPVDDSQEIVRCNMFGTASGWILECVADGVNDCTRCEHVIILDGDQNCNYLLSIIQ